MEQPEMTCGWFKLCAPKGPVEWINHELRGLVQLRDQSGQITLHSFYIFKSRLVENIFFPPDGSLFQTLYLIKKIVVKKQSYRKQEMAVLLWPEQNSCTSGLMHNWKCSGGLGGFSLCCLFLSSKTETSTSRSTNAPHNCQVRLSRLVFFDAYMATVWISRRLLRYNTSRKTSASVAADPELENSLWCDIDVPSEHRNVQKHPNPLL